MSPYTYTGEKTMKKTIILPLICCLSSPLFAATDLDQRANQSRAVVKEFMVELKGNLKAALKSGGPLEAIEVCNTKAQAVAEMQSKKHSWQVGRTSLKTRNPNNAPDAWERSVLEGFDTRKAAGEDPKKMEHYEVVTMNGKQFFRYMKAIPTAEKPCLVCHGSKIPPKVAESLDRHYPYDQARGYKAGDIRGAFTIIQPM